MEITLNLFDWYIGHLRENEIKKNSTTNNQLQWCEKRGLIKKWGDGGRVNDKEEEEKVCLGDEKEGVTNHL